MNEKYEDNDKDSSEMEEDEEAITKALQISLLEEENKVAKMKDLRDDLSRELKSTTQEFIQISKEAYITKQGKEINEETTIYVDKVKKGIEPQEQFYKLPDSLLVQLQTTLVKTHCQTGCA